MVTVLVLRPALFAILFYHPTSPYIMCMCVWGGWSYTASASIPPLLGIDGIGSRALVRGPVPLGEAQYRLMPSVAVK